MDPSELKVDAEPAQIAQDIKSLISTDPGFGAEYKAIQPKVTTNTDLFKHASSSATEPEFIEKTLEGMGYPKEMAGIILTNPKYANLAFDLKHKYRNYKDGYDRAAITDTYKLRSVTNPDGQQIRTREGNPMSVIEKDTARQYPKYEQVSDATKKLGIAPRIVEVNFNNRPNLDPGKRDTPVLKKA